jgi:mersacidin/lichenicidin family type 2 lantibiotic
MSNLEIIRAWKDEGYRNSLTDELRTQLPAHPSGSIEIDDDSGEEGMILLHPFRTPCHKCGSR